MPGAFLSRRDELITGALCARQAIGGTWRQRSVTLHIITLLSLNENFI